MPGRALVLDANILIRAVLGHRVRRILESYADSTWFFIPDTALAEAEEHLAALVVKRGGDAAKAVHLLRLMAALGTVVSRDLLQTSKGKLESGWLAVTRTTGRSWPLRWRSAVRFGLKTRISSVAASQRRQPRLSIISSPHSIWLRFTPRFAAGVDRTVALCSLPSQPVCALIVVPARSSRDRASVALDRRDRLAALRSLPLCSSSIQISLFESIHHVHRNRPPHVQQTTRLSTELLGASPSGAPVRNGTDGDNSMFNSVNPIGYLGSDAASRMTRDNACYGPLARGQADMKKKHETGK